MRAFRILAMFASSAVSLGLMAWPCVAEVKPAVPSSDPQDFLREPPRPASVKGRFRVVALGDLLYTNPQAANPDPGLQKVVQLIKSGDVAIANQEGEAFDLKTYAGAPYGNGQVYGSPGLARDYKAMGIEMVSMANNHSTDWGRVGLADSAALLDAAGVVHAGAGPDLAAARAAGVYQTPKGRVALVSTASTFKVNAGATDAFGDTPARGRPGAGGGGGNRPGPWV